MGLEVKGKLAVTFKSGEAFHQRPKHVRKVTNTSKTAPAKALVFYVTDKGRPLADISTEVK